MNRKKNLISSLYVLLACLHSIVKVMNSTYIERIMGLPLSTISSIITYASWIFLTIIFFSQNKISKKRFLSYVLILGIISLISLFIFDRTILTITFFIISYQKNINIHELGNKIFKCNMFLIITIIILSLIGLTTNYTFYQHGVLRQSLGFVSANACANTIVINYMLWSLISKKKNSFLKNGIWLTFLIVIYKITNSRMAFFMGIVSMLTNIFETKYVKKEKIVNAIYISSKYIIAFLFIICIFSTVYFNKNQGSKIYNTINDITTGRMNWVQNYYNDYGINLFGQKIKTVSLKQRLNTNETWTNIDNSYMSISIKYGIVFLLGFTILYIKVGEYARNKENYRVALYIFLIAIMGLTENILLTIGYNYSLFIIGKMLAENEKKDTEVHI